MWVHSKFECKLKVLWSQWSQWNIPKSLFFPVLDHFSFHPPSQLISLPFFTHIIMIWRVFSAWSKRTLFPICSTRISLKSHILNTIWIPAMSISLLVQSLIGFPKSDQKSIRNGRKCNKDRIWKVISKERHSNDLDYNFLFFLPKNIWLERRGVGKYKWRRNIMYVFSKVG